MSNRDCTVEYGPPERKMIPTREARLAWIQYGQLVPAYARGSKHKGDNNNQCMGIVKLSKDVIAELKLPHSL